jgi:ATP-dependent Zn protease
VHKVSIVRRGLGALGYTMQTPIEDRYLHTRPSSSINSPSCWRDGRPNS